MKQFFKLKLLLLLAMLCLGYFTDAQIQRVVGTVTGEGQRPLEGAAVQIVGKPTTGTLTDDFGKYAINAEKGDVLNVSFTGYASKQVTVGTEEIINISLTEEISVVDSVVVIGYGRQKKERVVAAISTVKGSELLLPNRSLQNSLAGRVAGLFAVQKSGEPGYDNAEIWIRGVSSFAGGTGALILVDGVPRKMTDISPEEIETFSVLKDASATAVYGAEGANGVILITSKRGKNQKTQINFRADYNINQPTRVMKFLSSADWIRLYNEAKWNTEGNPNMSNFTPYLPDSIISKYEDNIDPDLYPNTNWLDLLKNTASSQRYALNFRGGGERLKFFVATSYYNEEGLFKSNPTDALEFDKEPKYNVNIGLQRYNLRTNVDMDMTSTTKLNVDLSGQYLTTNYPGTGTSTIFASMMKSAPHLIPMVYSNRYPSRFSSSSGYENPYTLLNFKGYTKEYRVGLQSNVGLTQQLPFIPGLNFKAVVSFDADFQSTASRSRNPSEYYSN